MAEDDIVAATNVARIQSRDVPEELKTLRACLFCSMIKTALQFEKYGCTNCESFLHMKGNGDRVMECTSATFDG